MSALATPSIVSRLQSDASFLHSFVKSPSEAVGPQGAGSIVLASSPRELHGASVEAAQAPGHLNPTATAVPGGTVSSVHGPQTVSSVMPTATAVGGGHPVSSVVATMTAVGGGHPVSSIMPTATAVGGGHVVSSVMPTSAVTVPVSSVMPQTTPVSSVAPQTLAV
jgi:hypothetical protein